MKRKLKFANESSVSLFSNQIEEKILRQKHLEKLPNNKKKLCYLAQHIVKQNS